MIGLLFNNISNEKNKTNLYLHDVVPSWTHALQQSHQLLELGDQTIEPIFGLCRDLLEIPVRFTQNSLTY